MIAPCSILDRFVQWSCHLEKKQTKETNASSNNFKGLKFLLLSSLKKKKLSRFDQG
jgi:hypothetical protein